MDVFTGVELVDCAPNNGARHDRSDALVELTRLCNRAEVGDAAHSLAKAMIGDADPNEEPDEMTGYTILQFVAADRCDQYLKTHSH